MVKRRSSKDGERTAAVPGCWRNIYRLVAVSFGLLCTVQAVLNVSLRLALCLQSFKWMNFSGSLYYISSCVASWSKSRADCLQKGADLVIINNLEEQEFTRRFKKHAWIGLTYINRKWQWLDGTLLTTSYWGKSEPNNASGYEECAEIKNYYEVNSWNDGSCNLPRFWICEKLLPK